MKEKKNFKQKKRQKTSFSKRLDRLMVVAAILVTFPLIARGVGQILAIQGIWSDCGESNDFAYAFMSYAPTMFLGMLVFLQGTKDSHDESDRKDAELKSPYMRVQIDEPGEKCTNSKKVFLNVRNIGDGAAIGISYRLEPLGDDGSFDGTVLLVGESAKIEIPTKDIKKHKELMVKIRYENYCGYQYCQEIECKVICEKDDNKINRCRLQICKHGRQERLGEQ